jgi:hypothetical protein
VWATFADAELRTSRTLKRAIWSVRAAQSFKNTHRGVELTADEQRLKMDVDEAKEAAVNVRAASPAPSRAGPG